ncbi:hypothetical protein A1O1_00095 [Capronia coronata CBS 617.96]|uniref:Heterokaryon incompatibility domain-containing protein n=1 Tax=Capronia coronata CBS 617.96 TaxID=1182541 RepID=W9YPZ1_9EURO|nr:uncharacterized protein A1O1_00095 [Capronia coronata CBS 617.96]EXJ94977.1 hypothetical protein A1O1_00095 [Capronia coronata CBS 617.96]
MDHLPKPLQHLNPELVFPCRCDPNAVDDGPLETYPERRGYRLNLFADLNFANILALHDGSRPGVEQATTLLQEWLFFGLLQAAHFIYGEDFDGNDYVQGSGESMVLTLERLPQHADRWLKLEADREKTVRKQHFHDMEAHIMRALMFLTNNFTPFNNGGLDSTGSPRVVPEQSKIVVEPNLEILLMVLTEALECIAQTIQFRERRYVRSEQTPDFVCFSTRRLMDRLHWCPSELNLIDLVFDHGSFYFASRLARNAAQSRHSQCTMNKCLAFQMNVSTYSTVHITDCEGCNDLIVDQTELSAILERSDDDSAYPRVRVTITDADNVELSFTDQGEYVAVSHVWSDGLGHPPGINSLPECQVRRLRSLIHQTGMKEANIWIDSLCVPAHIGLAKRNALARMASVYRGARAVLVLDSDLLSIPSYCSNEELLLRVALCTWMRRLWTLEEGVVARSKLLFQFSDRSIALPPPRPAISDSIAFHCAALIEQYLPEDTSILSVITALHFRSTSWSSDEPLCIGYILDLDVSSIVALHDDPRLRMAELYRLLAKKTPTFPYQFLFTHEEKLDIPPFSWAPVSLMNLDPKDVLYLQGTGPESGIDATQTDRGLQFQSTYPSCLVSFGEEAAIKKCMIIQIDAVSYVLCPVPKGGKCRTHARFWEGSEKQLRLDVDPDQAWTERWRANYDGFRPPGEWGLIYSKSAQYGVMVATTEFADKGKTIYTELVGQVYMYEIRTLHASVVAGVNKEMWGQLGIPDMDEQSVRAEQEKAERELLAEGHYTPVNCDWRLNETITWCVG